MILDYFKIAMKNLKNRKLRSWLTMLGIILSIATIFTLVSLSLGLEFAVKEQFDILGADKLFIMPKTGLLGVPGSVGGDVLTEKDVEFISKIRGIKDYSYFVVGNGKVEFNDEIKYFMIIGIPLDKMGIFNEMETWETREGRMLEKEDKGDILIGCLFNDGDIYKKEVKLKDKLIINDEKFEVKGILAPIGNPGDDSSILLPIEAFRDLFEVETRVDEIFLQVEEGEDVLEVSERVEEKLRKYRGVTEKTQDFMISTPEELLQSFQNILGIITYFLAGIAAISLFVGAVGIANTMYTSVIERTREIGIMKAIGAKNSDILSIFLIESSLLGLVGSGIGIALGYGISKSVELIAINQLNTNLLQVASPFYLIFGCLFFGFIIGAISGTLPAIQASKTNVVDALHYE